MRSRTRPSAAVILMLQMAAVVSFLLHGCVSQSSNLWPPAPGERAYPIYVSLDTWHGMIGLPAPISAKPETGRLSEAEGTASANAGYEEWGYAERRWYVDGRQGSGGTMRALFWPTAGVVEVARHDRLWAERTPQPPADLFLLHVSEAGLLRLQRHLLATAASEEPIAAANGSLFYSSRRSYHLFHHCHHYVTRALREAGLPISPFWGMSRTLLSIRLAWTERLALALAEGVE